MIKFSKILALILALCLCLSGCIGVVDSEESIVPAMTYNTVSAENIVLPCDSYSCEGRQYTEIVTWFESAGFTNVNAIAQNSDTTKETRVNGSVIAVLVNNNIIFSQGALCSPDIEIRIYYVVSQITEQTVASSSQDDAVDSTVSQENISSQEIVSSKENLSSEETVSSSNVNIDVETDSVNVWVSESGSKYHNKSTCSGMKNPKEISKQDAEEQGYEPCKRCYKN